MVSVSVRVKYLLRIYVQTKNQNLKYRRLLKGKELAMF
jgi:hypothetical protein